MKAKACMGRIIIKVVTDRKTNLCSKNYLQNICFINRTEFSMTFPCRFKCNTSNAINLAKEYHHKKLKRLKIGIAPKSISESAMIVVGHQESFKALLGCRSRDRIPWPTFYKSRIS